jgi:hypothetical protein
MKGCVLRGKVAFSNPEKNSPRARRRLADAEGDSPALRDARGRRRK